MRLSPFQEQVAHAELVPRALLRRRRFKKNVTVGHLFQGPLGTSVARRLSHTALFTGRQLGHLRIDRTEPQLAVEPERPGIHGFGILEADLVRIDRKSTRLNSSHLGISYAV